MVGEPCAAGADSSSAAIAVHKFVEFIPDHLEPGVLYVSTTYATVAHLCMCGCGFEVTSPLSPYQWRMIFDGQTVSLSPSIGNWSFECESHYWLDRGTIDWAAQWSRERIAACQSHVPPQLRGRVFSAFDLIWQAMRLVSLLVGGVLADILGIHAVFYTGGVLLLAAALVGATAPATHLRRHR